MIAKPKHTEECTKHAGLPRHYYDTGSVNEGSITFGCAQCNLERAERAERELASVRAAAAPINMLLWCPNCGMKHVDAPEPNLMNWGGESNLHGMHDGVARPTWTNPPHKSHLCHRCGNVWRPASVPTNGVESIPPGASDNWLPGAKVECHGLDTPERVCFYEQDFYVLSNFSAFTIHWAGLRFDTSEAAYHWEKFPQSTNAGLRAMIRFAPSAHEAFKIAEANKQARRADWDAVKVPIMKAILIAKQNQHEYVRRKLLATGDRVLVENSWRDDFWGWGPNRDGRNMLGKLWMELRAELRGVSA